MQNLRRWTTTSQRRKLLPESGRRALPAGSLAHGAAAHELRDDPLLSARGRTAGMQHAQIRLQVCQRIDEVDATAQGAAMREPEFRKCRLAALVVVVQVRQEGDQALPVARDLRRVVA